MSIRDPEENWEYAVALAVSVVLGIGLAAVIIGILAL